MHELSVTSHLLDYVLQEAKERGAVRVRSISLKIGPFSGLVPECIQVYLDVLSKGTCAQGVILQSQINPLKVLCRDCGWESEITREDIACPRCRSLRLKRLSGKECYIDRLDMEIPAKEEKTDGSQSVSSGYGMESGCEQSSQKTSERKKGLSD
ncbi:MAG: hydrogenase maturation nickel metallochaperone HypA [Ruminococcus sp.]|jgi:hydrogenase nickel incorporation protein HypA/HybF